ncbi:hypothetical protein BDW66DRAFT_131030 [Aspergillus desertorum]
MTDPDDLYLAVSILLSPLVTNARHLFKEKLLVKRTQHTKRRKERSKGPRDRRTGPQFYPSIHGLFCTFSKTTQSHQVTKLFCPDKRSAEAPNLQGFLAVPDRKYQTPAKSGMCAESNLAEMFAFSHHHYHLFPSLGPLELRSVTRAIPHQF